MRENHAAFAATEDEAPGNSGAEFPQKIQTLIGREL